MLFKVSNKGHHLRPICLEQHLQKTVHGTQVTRVPPHSVKLTPQASVRSGGKTQLGSTNRDFKYLEGRKGDWGNWFDLQGTGVWMGVRWGNRTGRGTGRSLEGLQEALGTNLSLPPPSLQPPTIWLPPSGKERVTELNSRPYSYQK